MSTHELLERFAKLPPVLKRQQVLSVAKKLGLGQRRVAVWMASEATRQVRPGCVRFSYPRDATLTSLLDMAGLSMTMGAQPLANGSKQAGQGG